MTTYAAGGYSNTQVESYGGVGDGTKRRDSKGVFPITIAEITRNFNMVEDKLVVGDNEVTDITLVAQVESTKNSSTKVVFVLDDKSGATMEGNYWLDGDQDSATDIPAPRSYIRVFGKVKSFGGRAQLNLFAWKPVTNPDIISAHVLQTVLAHHSTLNPVPIKQQPFETAGASQFQTNAGAAAPSRGLGANRFAASSGTNNYNGNQGGLGGGILGGFNNVESLPAVQQEVFRLICSDKTGAGNGCHRDVLKRQLMQRFSHQQIDQALASLMNDGLVYNSLDSNHFSALEA